MRVLIHNVLQCIFSPTDNSLVVGEVLQALGRRRNVLLSVFGIESIADFNSLEFEELDYIVSECETSKPYLSSCIVRCACPL